jgi:hypothetical protein
MPPISYFILKSVLVYLLFVNIAIFADENTIDLDFDDNSYKDEDNLHPQLNAIYKRNQFMNIQLSVRNKSLDAILLTLKKLDEKIEYKLKTSSTDTNSNNLTMADFSLMDDELIRKCDEIVDNYYSRKSQQEKNYVQQLYNNEQSDPQWEREIEQQLQNFIANNNFSQSEFFDINCKSSVCKVRVQHKTSEASQQFRAMLREKREIEIYDSQNKYDRMSDGMMTDITVVRDSKKIREFVWGENN